MVTAFKVICAMTAHSCVPLIQKCGDLKEALASWYHMYCTEIMA